MVLDTALLSTEHYKVRVTGKVEQSKEKKYRPLLYLGVVAFEKGSLWLGLNYGGQLIIIITDIKYSPKYPAFVLPVNHQER